jgi:pectate lyase
VFRGPFPLLAVTLALAATAAACGDSRAQAYVRPMGGTVSCPDSMVGYAAVAGTDADGGVTGPTTGGNGGPTVTVNNELDLRTALQDPTPRVIHVDGMVAAAETIKVTVDRDVRNGNKTLIGLGASSGLTGAGLDLSYSDNVIVQNLKIAKVSIGEGDAITVLDSHHIWIDHCDLSSDRDDTTTGYDGLVDITHGSSNVTVSWTQYHDHKDTGLVGHTNDPTAEAEDRALQVTFHHNLFLNVNSGPRVRWGTAHAFSNHFQNVTAYGVASLSSATVLVDHNLFDATSVPITTLYQDPLEGTMTEIGNKFPAGATTTINVAAPPVMVPYAYSSDAAESVSAIVSRCAGTGKINLP